MWVSDIYSIIFTRVKNEVANRVKNKYPNIRFTDSNIVPTDPKFPTVYIHELPGVETGQDLEGLSINAFSCTIQIEVTDNVSQNRAIDVMKQVVASMKRMRFLVVSMPEFQNEERKYRSVARFRRIIGYGDEL